MGNVLSDASLKRIFSSRIFFADEVQCTRSLTRARLSSADDMEDSNSVELEDMTDNAMNEEHALFDDDEAKKKLVIKRLMKMK